MILYFHGGKITWKYPIQKIIQIGTDSEFWHVEAKYDDRLYIGSSPRYGGVDIRPIDLLKPLDNNCYIVEAKIQIPIHKEKYLDFLVSRVNRPFSMGALRYLGWLKLTGNRNQVNKWISEYDPFCSQIIADAIMWSAVDQKAVGELLIRPNGTISPADLVRWKGIKVLGRRI